MYISSSVCFNANSGVVGQRLELEVFDRLSVGRHQTPEPIYNTLLHWEIGRLKVYGFHVAEFGVGFYIILDSWYVWQSTFIEYNLKFVIHKSSGIQDHRLLYRLYPNKTPTSLHSSSKIHILIKFSFKKYLYKYCNDV